MKNKRLMNFRYIFFCAIFLFLGIFFAPRLMNLNYRYIVLFVVVFCLVFGFGIYLKKSKIVVALVLAFVIGFGSFNIEVLTYGNNYISSEAVSVVGRVKVKNESIILEDVFLNGEKSGNLLVQGNINCSVGDNVSFSAVVSPVELFEFGYFNTFYYRQKVTHSCFTSSANVDYESPNFLEKFRLDVKEIMKRNMNEDNASVAYASIFGDTSEIDNEIIKDFRKTGISHLLAVSGLHITFLSAILLWLLNLTKLKKKYCLIILASILFIYCFLCSFTPSVVRATLMSLILFCSYYIFGRQSDALNSIGFVAILILLINPFSAFDIGFELSFMCVLSIFLFARTFTKIFRKWRFPKFLSYSLSVSIATQIGIIPISIGVFGEIATFSIFANIICIPIFQAGYTLALIFTPIVLIFNSLGGLMSFSGLFYRAVMDIAHFVANIKYSIIEFYFSSVAICLSYYIILFINSRYIKTKNIKKLFYSFICLFIGSVFYLLFLIPQTPKMNLCGSEETYAITDSSGKATIVVLTDNYYTLINMIEYLEINEIENLIVKNNNIYYLIKNNINKYIKINNYYLFDNILEINNNNLQINTIKYTSNILGFELIIENKSFFFETDEFDEFDKIAFEEDSKIYDYAIIDKFERQNNFVNVIDNKFQSEFKNFTFNFQNGNLKVRKIY